MESTVTTQVCHSVQRFYEAHPYPRYPLLASPRWQEGYLSHPGFARKVARQTGLLAAPTLLVGAGEILPAVVCPWLPRRHPLEILDLSARSLRRARFRLARRGRQVRTIHCSIEHYLATSGTTKYGHIDAYGVLHHTANPVETLEGLSQLLLPGGTMRLMVYNTSARSFLKHLQKAFDLLGLSPHNNKDLAFAKQMLELWAEDCPYMALRLKHLGPHTLNNRARFADTFLHPRESRLPLGTWWRGIETAGLQIKGVFDRYAELDDLEASLWHTPSLGDLEDRSADLRFENNYEFYLFKPGRSPKVGNRRSIHWRTPPRHWFAFEETKSLSWSIRWSLWHAHQQALSGTKSEIPKNIPQQARQRLYRIGAILPQQLDNRQEARARAPMCAHMNAPVYPAAKPIGQTKVPDFLKAHVPFDKHVLIPHVCKRLDSIAKKVP